MEERKIRELTLDLTKTIAIFSVMVIHVGSGILTQEMVGSFEWSCGLFWGSLVRSSVPLFLMASGAIMLNPMKKIPLKKLFCRNIARIVVAMLVWGFCYKLYHLIGTEQLNFIGVVNSFRELLFFDQEFHFYYIHIILLVYVFLPITRIFAEKADKKTIEYALCLWAVLAILYPTLRNFEPFSLLSGIPGQWMINLTYASIGYGLFGYYLKQYPLPPLKGMVCFCVGFIATFGMTFYFSVKHGVFTDIFLQGTSFGVFLLATGLFSLADRVKVKGFFEKTIVFVSKASFCVYLAHMFILYILARFGIEARMLPAFFSIPLVSGLLLLICLIIYYILSRIPFLRKWII